jgi:hypothetical protein
VLFLIKVPTKQEFISSQKDRDSIEVEYFKFNKEMVKISKKFLTSTVLNFLNPDFDIENFDTEGSPSRCYNINFMNR